MTVRVRLFAAARDAAGRGEDTVSAGPLPDVLGTLEARYGERFAAVLSVATVLVDGSAVERDAPVTVPDGAEVAILPPFSGGAHLTRGQRGRQAERRYAGHRYMTLGRGGRGST